MNQKRWRFNALVLGLMGCVNLYLCLSSFAIDITLLAISPLWGIVFILFDLFMLLLSLLFFWYSHGSLQMGFDPINDKKHFVRLLADLGIKNPFKLQVYEGDRQSRATRYLRDRVLYYVYYGQEYWYSPDKRIGPNGKSLKRKLPLWYRFSFVINEPHRHVLVFDRFDDSWTLYEY